VDKISEIMMKMVWQPFCLAWCAKIGDETEIQLKPVVRYSADIKEHEIHWEWYARHKSRYQEGIDFVRDNTISAALSFVWREGVDISKFPQIG
jgi:hypothetical protein